MHRRQFVRAFPVSLIGATAFSPPATAQSLPPQMVPAQYGGFAEWLDAARAAALEWVRATGATNAEQFMQLLTLWATAMPDPAELDWQAIAGANERLEAATVSRGRPFVVGALRMAPGCIVPLHCHPSGGAVSVCTRGAVVMQHYDLVPGAAAFTETGAIVEVDEASVARLTKDRFTHFTPTRANLHTFAAGPKGATLVEVAVQWGGSTGAFSYLKLEEASPAARSSSVRRRRGIWVGMDIARAYP